jgi:hypothetical protein
MVLRRKVVQKGTSNQSSVRQGGKLNNIYNYSNKGKEYNYRYRMIQIPGSNIAEFVHHFLRLGRKDSTGPHWEALQKTTCSVGVRKTKDQDSPSRCGTSEPERGWRGGARKEGWCARMESKGRIGKPTSHPFNSRIIFFGISFEPRIL